MRRRAPPLTDDLGRRVRLRWTNADEARRVSKERWKRLVRLAGRGTGINAKRLRWRDILKLVVSGAPYCLVLFAEVTLRLSARTGVHAIVFMGVAIAIGMALRQRIGWRRRQRVIARGFLRHHLCPSCVYDLREVPPTRGATPDGSAPPAGGMSIVTCPECGCAWRHERLGPRGRLRLVRRAHTAQAE